MLRSSLIVLVLVCAAAIVIARLIDDQVVDDQGVPPPVAGTVVVAEPSTMSAPGYGQEADDSDHAALPDYRLHGTLAGVTPASALIAAEPGATVLRYRVGEQLPGGAVLQGVSARSAVLEFAGERHTLLFVDSTADTGGLAPEPGATSLPAYGLRDGEENLPPQKDIAPDAGQILRRSATGPELTPEQRAKHEALALED